MTARNYYQYTADSNRVFAIMAEAEIAALMFMFHAAGEPRLDNRVTTRKLLLAEFVTGKELLVTDPDIFWTYPLGNLVAFKGDIYYVAARFQEAGHSMRPG